MTPQDQQTIQHTVEHTVQRNTDGSRYELLVDGSLVGYADFHDRDGVLVFPHTLIDSDKRGQGYGDLLVKGALDDVRERGQTIVPSCWFVREFIESRPEYSDLLAQ